MPLATNDAPVCLGVRVSVAGVVDAGMAVVVGVRVDVSVRVPVWASMVVVARVPV